jgi:DNA-binding MurR/RpiR family transcriptional regulator
MAQTQAPTNVTNLLVCIGRESDQLSRQLYCIARYVQQHSRVIGHEKIVNLAHSCNVQPSAVVRFAKHFGFHGYRDFKAVFRNDASAHHSV